MTDINKSSICLLVLLAFIQSGLTMECYICDRQESNTGKCLATLKTCDPGEEMCLTEISWGTTPYWQAGAEKQFYISKRCAKEKECEKAISKTLPFCTHIWYEDWRCAECCAGDKCNYYIMSGTTKTSSSLLTIILLSVFFILRTF